MTPHDTDLERSRRRVRAALEGLQFGTIAMSSNTRFRERGDNP